MKYCLPFLLLICSSSATLAPTVFGSESDAKKKFAAVRDTDISIDEFFLCLGLTSLPATLGDKRSEFALRLIVYSSWGTHIYTLVSVNDREMRLGEDTKKDKYLLMVDDAEWEHGRFLFKSSRTARILTPGETADFNKRNVDKQLAAAAREVPNPPPPGVIDGSTFIWEWIRSGHYAAFYEHMNPSRGDPKLRDTILFIYGLGK